MPVEKRTARAWVPVDVTVEVPPPDGPYGPLAYRRIALDLLLSSHQDQVGEAAKESPAALAAALERWFYWRLVKQAGVDELPLILGDDGASVPGFNDPLAVKLELLEP